MRGFRRPLIGIIILALLGGYYYFYEIRYRSKKAKEKEISERIYPVTESDISKIVYQKGKEKIVLEKKGEGWQVVSPVKAKADKKTVNSFLETFPGLKSFRKISDVKWDDPMFGLSKDPVQVTFYDRKGKGYSAAFGHKNPTNSYFYTLKGKSKTVLLVWVYPDKLLEKSLYDFRFKKVLAVSSDQVEKVEFEKGNNLRVVLEKAKKHDWSILEPIHGRGDRYAIEGFLSTATGEKVIRFLDNPPEKPEMFGWDHPCMKITLHWAPKASSKKEGKKNQAPEAKEKTATILVGKNRDASHVYVKISDNPSVMIVKNNYVKELDKRLFDFRNKNVWNFEIDNVTGVKYEDPEDHLTIEARKFPKEDVWKLIKPKEALADTRAVENWLWDLSGYRVKQFLSKAEFSVLSKGTPSYSRLFEISVKGSKSPLKLELFHVNGKWIAQSGEPDWYYVLDPKDVPKTFKTAFDLKYRRLVQFEDTDVARVKIKKNGHVFTFKKKKNLWYQQVKDKDKKIPNIDVLNFLWELSDLRYKELLKKSPEKGILSKAVEVVLFDKKGKSLGHLFFAAAKNGRGLVFKVKGRKELFFIGEQGIKKFEDAYHKLARLGKKEKE